MAAGGENAAKLLNLTVPSGGSLPSHRSLLGGSEAEEQLTLSAPPHGIEQCVDCRSVPWPVADVVQPNDPLRVDDYVASQLADIATRHPETPPP